MVTKTPSLRTDMFPLVMSDVLAAIVFVVAFQGFFPEMASWILFGAAWLLFAVPLLTRTGVLLRERRFLDEHFLLLLASLTALVVKRFPEAITILLIYRLGRYLQERLAKQITERCRNIIAKTRPKIGETAPSPTTTSPEEIERLIAQALTHKSRPVRLLSRFVHWYTPTVVFIAFFFAITPLFGLGDLPLTDSVYHAAMFLVLACPAVLVVSVPLAGWATLATLAGRGILVTEDSAVETLSQVKTFVIVMNGILTRGIKEVIEILPVEGMSSKRLLAYAAIAEAESPHPVAIAIREHFGKPIPYGTIEEVHSEAGGVVVSYEGREIAVGSAAFFRKLGIEPGPEATIGTTVQVALDRFFIGRIVVGDEPRPEGEEAISRLRKAGIKKIIVLSGDNPLLVERYAREIGCNEGIGGLTPAEKASTLEQIIAQANGPVAVAGHAFDDAPLIARADIGIAAGDAPAKRAMEIADVVVTTPGPCPLATAVDISRKGYAVALQNLLFALWIKGALLVCGAFGIAPLWALLSADTISAIILLLNTARITAGVPSNSSSAELSR